jgi:hypothetical protein
MIRFLLSRIGCLMMIFGIIVLVVGVAAAQSGEPGPDLIVCGLCWERCRVPDLE